MIAEGTARNREPTNAAKMWARRPVKIHASARSRAIQTGEMHALCWRSLQTPATQMIFGKIDGRHRPDQYIMQRYCNRRGDLVHRQTHATAIDNNVLSGYSGVKPKKIPIADPSAMECGVSAMAINVM